MDKDIFVCSTPNLRSKDVDDDDDDDNDGGEDLCSAPASTFSGFLWVFFWFFFGDCVEVMSLCCALIVTRRFSPRQTIKLYCTRHGKALRCGPVKEADVPSTLGRGRMRNLYFTSSGLTLVSHLIYPLTARVVGAPQMISQPASSIFPLFSTALCDFPNSLLV